MALRARAAKDRTSEVAHAHKVKSIKYVEVNEDDQIHAFFASQEKREIDAKSLVTANLWQHVGTACHLKSTAWV